MEIKVGHELCYYNNIPIETLWAADIQLIIMTMFDVNNLIILELYIIVNSNNLSNEI